MGTSDISSYGIYNDSFWWEPTFEGNGSLTVEAGDGKADSGSWSVGIYSKNDVIVGADCTITATSGTASTSAAIYIGNWNSKLSTTWSTVTAGNSADSATEVDITSTDFDSNGYKYMKIEPAPVQSVTAINVTGVTAPVIGQTPDFSTPSFVSTPENAVTVYGNINYRWLKISKDSYTGTSDDIWTPMTSADKFEADYYYRYGVEFKAKVGYKIPANVTGTINGSACTVIAASENYPVMLKTVFGPLTAEHTRNLTLVPAVPATSAATGNIQYYHCENCGKDYYDEAGAEEIPTKEAIVIKKLAPKIVEGNNAKIDKASKEPVPFRSDAAFVDFIRVEVDGKALVKDKDYTLKEGSIIVLLTSEFTATLTVGEHALGIVSASGTALASFTVMAGGASDNVPENNPQTGDDGNIILWSFIAVISLAALCTTGLIFQKKKVR